MANEFIIKNGFRSQGNSEVTGSFVNILTPTSLKIQSVLSSSILGGFLYTSGLGWNSLELSGSQTAFRSDTDTTLLNGIIQGNIRIPAFGVSFPYKGNISTVITSSDNVSAGTQLTDSTSIGGSVSLTTTQNGIFSGSYGKNEYLVAINKNYTTDEGSLNIQKRNNAGETISLNLNSGNDGFSVFSTLSQPTSSFLRLVSGSTNLTEFRYDANYIQRSTIIGSDTSTSPSARLQVKGAGATSATETLRITDSNDTSLFKIFDNGSISQGNTSAAGNYSHAEGLGTLSSGSYSHTEGSSTQAIGDYSHAEGYVTLTLGLSSHAEGAFTTAFGEASHTEGRSTQAIGDYSHAEGYSTFANGYASHAEGNTTFADGYASHAEGDNTQAQGDFSHAEGAYTITTDAYQHAQGQYNLAVSGAGAFIVGNGINNLNRSNLIFASGSTVQITGSLDVTSTSSASALLRISSPASSSILFVSGSGRVGIGTNTPDWQFNVRTLSGTGAIQFSNTGVRIGETNGIGYDRIFGDSTTLVIDANNIIDIRYQAANRIRISAAGNLLLGTTTDSARLQVRGSGATSATTTFLLQNSTPTNLMTVLDNGQVSFTSPTIALATTQSAFTISQSISASNVVGGQYYGVNITPTFFATTSSQTETALRVAATFTGSTSAVGGQNIIADFGATSAGSQFTVTDVTSGSIYMVNDVSGLPIIEATSDWTVNMYNYPNLVFNKTGSQVNIFGTLRVSGSFILPLSQSAAPQTGSAYWSGSFLFVYDGTQYRSSSFA